MNEKDIPHIELESFDIIRNVLIGGESILTTNYMYEIMNIHNFIEKQVNDGGDF